MPKPHCWRERRCASTLFGACLQHYVKQEASAQVAKGQRGCIVFTSSAAAAIASPFTALYAATKSFLSAFGASLAVEVRHRGIDVLVFHPSPVATR